MGQLRKLFVPFGELRPDNKQLNNAGLTDAVGVIPVHGNYVAAQVWGLGGDAPSDEPYGLHVHFDGGSSWYAYLGTITKLYQYSSVLTAMDKTRTVGGAYGTSGAGGEAGWQSASFGNAIVMTNYVDDPQFLASPSTGNFTKLAQSGSGNPGMDPKAKFVGPIRNNLFLANLNLSAGFDGLSSGANPTAVCWSQSENIRQFGSFNATPELIGAGYQSLNYDLGHINGFIGGEYGLFSLQKGWVRVDGPPYTFFPFGYGHSSRFPNSIVRHGEDVFYWGPSGPTVLRGGSGTPVVLGDGKIARTLIDNSTLFSPLYSIYSGIAIRHVSVSVDAANNLIVWNFTSTANGGTRIGDFSVVYNDSDGRFSFVENRKAPIVAPFGPASGILFMRSIPDLGSSWSPGRDFLGVMQYTQTVPSPTTTWSMARPSYSAGLIINDQAPTMVGSYLQLDRDLTTRIHRARPVFSRSYTSTSLSTSITVSTKNKPYDDAVGSGVFTEADTHGWIVTPSTVFGDFHQTGLTVSGSEGGIESIVELEGIEIEFELGGRYAA